MALAAGLLLLAAMPANAQQRGVSDGVNEKVVSMNGFSSDKSYIVYLSWQPSGTDANIVDIFIHESATGARLGDIKYDIGLYKSGELVASSQRTGQTTTRQFYDFENQSQYTVRVSNIEGSGEWIDFAIQVTPEFPLHVYALVSAVFAYIIAVHRLRTAA